MKGLDMHLPRHVLLAVVLAATFASTPTARPYAAVTEQTCPAGTSPASTARFGELFLPTGAIPYTIIGVYRYTLEPGETMSTKPDVPVMYIVESGELHYPTQDWTGVYLRPSCVPFVAYNMAIADASRNSSGGTLTVSEADQIRVTAGQTLVAEHGLLGPLSNERNMPLVLLEVSMSAPEIDPTSGLPIVDPTTANREQDRAFALRKQDCRVRLRAMEKGTPVAHLPVYIEAPEPTPAYTTAKWASRIRGERSRVPQACRGQNIP